MLPTNGALGSRQEFMACACMCVCIFLYRHTSLYRHWAHGRISWPVYVCMYVCMYVGLCRLSSFPMYICMYVYAWTMGSGISLIMACVCMSVCMYVCVRVNYGWWQGLRISVYAYVYACMYVCLRVN
jgi:hypothetical protein